MSIVLVGSTSGSITLQEPAVAGTTVLDLPATSGTIITTGSTGQVIPKAALPTGSVLQVVQGSTSTQVTSSSTTAADTGLTATITPLYTTSKILVIANTNGLRKSGGHQFNAVYVSLLRNSTQISVTQYYGFTGTALDLVVGGSSQVVLDSPATTSAITYKTQFYNFTAAAQVSVQDGGSVSTITLMEIAA